MGKLQLEKIYLRQCVLNFTQGAELPNQTEEPIVNYGLQVNNQLLSEENSKHEVLLILTAEYKQADKVIAKLQLQQAGVFVAEDFTPEQLEAILQGYCVNQLFPHLHARAAELTQQAGLKPLMLPMMDFTMIYQQAKAKKQAEKEAKAKGEETITTSSKSSRSTSSALH